MLARRLSPVVLAAVAIVALGAAVRADEPTTESLRAKIAALDLDGARADLKILTSRATLQQQVELKELNRQITIGLNLQKILGRITTLLDLGKAREAYYEGMAVVGDPSRPGDIGLAALRVRLRDARENLALVVDDFDRTEVPSGTATAGDVGGKLRAVGEVLVGNSKVEAVPDPLGGGALRWTWDSMRPQQRAAIAWALPREVNLAGFSYLSFRFHHKKEFRKVSNFRNQKDFLFASVLSGKAGPGEAATFGVDLVDLTDLEVRVPVEKLVREAKFDARRISGVSLSCYRDDEQIVIDDIMLVRKEN